MIIMSTRKASQVMQYIGQLEMLQKAKNLVAFHSVEDVGKLS